MFAILPPTVTALDSGIPLNNLQQQIGHTDLKTNEIKGISNPTFRALSEV
jgi:hypothetical protein